MGKKRQDWDSKLMKYASQILFLSKLYSPFFQMSSYIQQEQKVLFSLDLDVKKIKSIMKKNWFVAIKSWSAMSY